MPSDQNGAERHGQELFATCPKGTAGGRDQISGRSENNQGIYIRNFEPQITQINADERGDIGNFKKQQVLRGKLELFTGKSESESYPLHLCPL